MRFLKLQQFKRKLETPKASGFDTLRIPYGRCGLKKQAFLINKTY